MFKKKRKLKLIPKSDLLNKPDLSLNSIEFSLFHWRSANAFSFLSYRPRFFGPFAIDVEEATNSFTLYLTYLLNIKLFKNKELYNFQFITDLRWSRYFDFLSIHYIYFIELWTRPNGFLDVWTNEEEFDYATVKLFYLSYYSWSHPKLFIDFSFPFISDFSSFFSFDGPNKSFIKYDLNKPITFGWRYYDDIDRIPVYVYDMCSFTGDDFIINDDSVGLLPVQEHYRDSVWDEMPIHLLLDHGRKYNLADFYYLYAYILRKSYFLNALFFDVVLNKLYHYGALGYFFFDSTLSLLEDLTEKQCTFSQSITPYVSLDADIISLVDELEVEEEDAGYDLGDEEYLHEDEDFDELDDYEDDDLDELEDVEALDEPDFSDFEVEVDTDDDMEFNDDVLTI